MEEAAYKIPFVGEGKSSSTKEDELRENAFVRMVNFCKKVKKE